MPKEYKHYDDELKINAVNMHVEQGISLHRIARKLNISDASVIRKWVRARQNFGDEWLKERRGRPRLSKNTSSEAGAPPARMTLAQAKQYIAILEAENQRLKSLIGEPEAEVSDPVQAQA